MAGTRKENITYRTCSVCGKSVRVGVRNGRLAKHGPSYACPGGIPKNLKAENATLKIRVSELEEFAREVADNYDCDEDAHRYGTRCRACEAAKLLNKK